MRFQRKKSNNPAREHTYGTTIDAPPPAAAKAWMVAEKENVMPDGEENGNANITDDDNDGDISSGPEV